MNRNIAIIGLPRSGKTTKAIQLFRSFSGNAIFINTQYEQYFNSGEYTVLNEFNKWNYGVKKAVINPPDKEDLLDFIVYLFEQQQRHKKQIPPIRIIIDEIYHYQDYQDGKYILTKLIVDGLRWNIQTVITAHMPTMVNHVIYKNIHIYYFYELNDSIYDYFKRVWRIDLYKYKDYLGQRGKYNYILYDMRNFIKGCGVNEAK